MMAEPGMSFPFSARTFILFNSATWLKFSEALSFNILKWRLN